MTPVECLRAASRSGSDRSELLTPSPLLTMNVHGRQRAHGSACRAGGQHVAPTVAPGGASIDLRGSTATGHKRATRPGQARPPESPQRTRASRPGCISSPDGAVPKLTIAPVAAGVAASTCADQDASRIPPAPHRDRWQSVGVGLRVALPAPTVVPGPPTSATIPIRCSQERVSAGSGWGGRSVCLAVSTEARPAWDRSTLRRVPGRVRSPPAGRSWLTRRLRSPCGLP